MKTRRWSEEQIIGILQQAEKGETTISALCRAQGVSENIRPKGTRQVAPKVWRSANQRGATAARTGAGEQPPQKAAGGFAAG